MVDSATSGASKFSNFVSTAGKKIKSFAIDAAIADVKATKSGPLKVVKGICYLAVAVVTILLCVKIILLMGYFFSAAMAGLAFTIIILASGVALMTGMRSIAFFVGAFKQVREYFANRKMLKPKDENPIGAADAAPVAVVSTGATSTDTARGVQTDNPVRHPTDAGSGADAAGGKPPSTDVASEGAEGKQHDDPNIFVPKDELTPLIQEEPTKEVEEKHGWFYTHMAILPAALLFICLIFLIQLAAIGVFLWAPLLILAAAYPVYCMLEAVSGKIMSTIDNIKKWLEDRSERKRLMEKEIAVFKETNPEGDPSSTRLKKMEEEVSKLMQVKEKYGIKEDSKAEEALRTIERHEKWLDKQCQKLQITRKEADGVLNPYAEHPYDYYEAVRDIKGRSDQKPLPLHKADVETIIADAGLKDTDEITAEMYTMHHEYEHLQAFAKDRKKKEETDAAKKTSSILGRIRSRLTKSTSTNPPAAGTNPTTAGTGEPAPGAAPAAGDPPTEPAKVATGGVGAGAAGPAAAADDAEAAADDDTAKPPKAAAAAAGAGAGDLGTGTGGVGDGAGDVGAEAAAGTAGPANTGTTRGQSRNILAIMGNNNVDQGLTALRSLIGATGKKYSDDDLKTILTTIKKQPTDSIQLKILWALCTENRDIVLQKLRDEKDKPIDLNTIFTISEKETITLGELSAKKQGT